MFSLFRKMFDISKNMKPSGAPWSSVSVEWRAPEQDMNKDVHFQMIPKTDNITAHFSVFVIYCVWYDGMYITIPWKLPCACARESGGGCFSTGRSPWGRNKGWPPSGRREEGKRDNRGPPSESSVWSPKVMVENADWFSVKGWRPHPTYQA